MSLFKDIKETSRLNRTIADLRKENEIKQSQLVQMSQNILLLKEEVETKFVGNAYRDYGTAVQAISDKYNCLHEWGVFQVGNIIDLRSAFIMGEGISVKPVNSGSGKSEMDFVKEFLKYNGLDRIIAFEFAKESEIEGRILLRLFWDDKDKMVSVRFVPWTSKKYSITTDPRDYLDYKTAEWTDGTEKVVLKPEDFIYCKFGGRINDPNQAAPRIQKCLSKIDDLDAALRDYREINRIHSAPLLWLKFVSASDAQTAQADLDKRNWKIKKGVCTNGDVNYAQPSIAGIESLEREIILLAKFISGTTGVPIHFLGLPDQLANRATADDLFDLIVASTTIERVGWVGTFEETITKAIALHNEKTGLSQTSKKLDPKLLKVNIPIVTRQQWEQLQNFFLPAAISGKISDDLFLSKIPGIDVDDEMKKKEEKQKFAKLNAPKLPFNLLKEDEEDPEDPNAKNKSDLFGNSGNK